MPGRSPVSPQGTGRMVLEPNEPRFAPKLPGVGFWHALACRRKRACAACAGLSATKIIEQWGREGVCSKENLKIYHYATFATMRYVSKLLLRLTLVRRPSGAMGACFRSPVPARLQLEYFVCHAA